MPPGRLRPGSRPERTPEGEVTDAIRTSADRASVLKAVSGRSPDLAERARGRLAVGFAVNHVMERTRVMHSTLGTAAAVTAAQAVIAARRLGVAVALALLAWAPSALAASVQPIATLRDDLADAGVEALSVDATQGTVAVTPQLGEPYLVRYSDEAELAELIPLVARRQGAIELTWLPAESSDRTTLAELSAALERGPRQVTVDPERRLLYLQAEDGATTTLAFRSETAVSMLLAAQGVGVEVVRTTDPPPRSWWEWLLLGLTIAVLAALLWVLLRRFHATSPGRASVDDAERAAQG